MYQEIEVGISRKVIWIVMVRHRSAMGFSTDYISDRSNRQEDSRRRSHITVRGLRVLSALVAAAGVTLGVYSSTVEHGVRQEAVAIGRVLGNEIDGGAAPSQGQLRQAPKADILIREGDTPWFLVGLVDPNANEPTRYAILKFIIDTDGSVLYPGQSINVPIEGNEPRVPRQYLAFDAVKSAG